MTSYPPRRRVARPAGLAPVLGALGFALAATAAATASPLAPQRPSAEQTGRVSEICRLVVGLPAGPYSQYEACEESLAHSLADAPMGGKLQPEPATAQRPTSYFSASTGEIHRREGGACTLIGYDPATYAFAQCVADLQSRLFDADHPIQ